KAKVSKDGERFQFPKEDKSNKVFSISDKLEDFIENEIIHDEEVIEENLAELDYIWSIYEFENLEDIIRLSHSLKNENESKISKSEEHTSELQSRFDLVCRLLLEKKKKKNIINKKKQKEYN